MAHVLRTVHQAIETTEKVVAATRQLKASLMRHLFTYGPVSVEEADKVDLKQTEVGTIPRSWNVEALGKVCRFTTGKLNSNEAVPGGAYPFFTCSQEDYRIDRYSFDSEAILLAGNNARGVYSVKHYRGKFDAYQRTYLITVKDKCQLKYQYLRYALETNLLNLQQQSIGTSTKFLTLGILQKLEIPVPPIEEQESIGTIMESVHNKIRMETAMKEALNTLRISLLKHLMTGRLRVNDLGLPLQEPIQ